jgi:hypothetical protein
MSMKKTVILIAALVFAALPAPAQTVTTVEALQLKVTKMLLKKDLRVLAEELAQSRDNRVDALLVALDVYGRAGQTERLRQTIVRLAQAPDLPPPEARKWVLDVVRQEIARDLAARRLFYEHLTHDDGYYYNGIFTSQWRAEGDAAELAAWLEKRAAPGSGWFLLNLERRLDLGTAAPVIEDLAARVRAEPTDRDALNYYLQIVKHAQTYSLNKLKQPLAVETGWLADLYPARNAVEAYRLGVLFDQADAALAIKYYQESLARTVADEDLSELAREYSIQSSIGQLRPIDLEKRLRYQTKEKLAAVYQRTGASALAQPLVEELIAAKDEAAAWNTYQLAGAVQAGSGARAVETKVLLDENTRAGTIDYWSERIRYYQGRGESQPVVQAFREALAKIPAAEKERFVSWFADFYEYTLRTGGQAAELRPQFSQILLEEFNRAPIGSGLALEIALAASDEVFDLAEFKEAVYIRRRDVLLALVEKRPEWDGNIDEMLIDALEDERLAAEQKSFYLAGLEKAAARGPLERRLDLDRVFERLGEHARRIPLLVAFLRDAPLKGERSGWQPHAAQQLFDAYYQTGDWQAAEKLMLDRQSAFLGNWGVYLERTAICAGRQNATRDALRLWLQTVNFFGHSPGGLYNLAETPAKPLLREYYLEMKRRDPASPIPDAALKILR